VGVIIIVIILGPGGAAFTRGSACNRAQGYAWRAVVESSVYAVPPGIPLGLGVGGRQLGRARAGGSADVCFFLRSNLSSVLSRGIRMATLFSHYPCVVSTAKKARVKQQLASGNLNRDLSKAIGVIGHAKSELELLMWGQHNIVRA